MWDVVFVTMSKGVTDMLDTTLLDSNEPLTMQALRDRFRDNDFSTQTSRYKFKTASSEKNRMYLKAKGIFRSFWNHQMKKFCKKGSLKNFSVDHNCINN